MNGKLWFSAPKGGRQRHVPLPGNVSLVLASHIAAWPPVSVTLPWNEPGSRRHSQMETAELLFSTPAGDPVSPYSFSGRPWRTARQAAGLTTGGPHQLRHFYASTLLAGGVDIRALAEYLGHHDPAITLRIYAHLMPAAEGRALRAVEAALGDSGEDHGPGTAHGGKNVP